MMKNFSRSLVRRPSEATVVARAGFVGMTGLPFGRKWTVAQGPQPYRTDPAAVRARSYGRFGRSVAITLKGQ